MDAFLGRNKYAASRSKLHYCVFCCMSLFVEALMSIVLDPKVFWSLRPLAHPATIDRKPNLIVVKSVALLIRHFGSAYLVLMSTLSTHVGFNGGGCWQIKLLKTRGQPQHIQQPHSSGHSSSSQRIHHGSSTSNGRSSAGEC